MRGRGGVHSTSTRAVLPHLVARAARVGAIPSRTCCISSAFCTCTSTSYCTVGTSVQRRDIEGKAEQAVECAVERETESVAPLRSGGVGLSCAQLGLLPAGAERPPSRAGSGWDWPVLGQAISSRTKTTEHPCFRRGVVSSGARSSNPSLRSDGSGDAFQTFGCRSRVHTPA